MIAKIFCRNQKSGYHSFYLAMGKNEYLLFSQDYSKSVEVKFRNGVTIDEALRYRSAHNHTISKTASKLFSAIKKLEKEYYVSVLEKRATRALRKYDRGSYRESAA